ncbi:hypothetical protein [Erwinia sp.]|uniref:hypothetical protein n=1 Tax=Erwinia citreus TaxID=558 RepID=UPI00289BCA09|nr:hypothetical protein [Erwinia sp.]
MRSPVSLASRKKSAGFPPYYRYCSRMKAGEKRFLATLRKKNGHFDGKKDACLKMMENHQYITFPSGSKNLSCRRC